MIPQSPALAVLVEGEKARGILGGKEPAAPRIDSRKCDPGKTWREKKTDLSTHLKVANRSFFVAESPIEGVRLAAGGAGAKSETLFARSPLGDSKGHSPWRAFGDFPRDGKVTRVQGGAPASGVAGAASPA